MTTKEQFKEAYRLAREIRKLQDDYHNCQSFLTLQMIENLLQLKYQKLNLFPYHVCEQAHKSVYRKQEIDMYHDFYWTVARWDRRGWDFMDLWEARKKLQRFYELRNGQIPF